MRGAIDLLFDPPVPALPDTELPEYDGVEPPKRGIRRLATTQWVAEGIDVDDVPAMIATELQRYFAIPHPEYILLLQFPAGTGKTTGIVKFAESICDTMQVMYVAPRHDVFTNDIPRISQRIGDWFEWQPRRGADEEKGIDATCRYPDEINAWMRRGHQAYSFCEQYNVCGWKYMKQSCVYHQQVKTKKKIIFAQHAHVALSHPLMQRVKALFGDEIPMSAFLHPWQIPRSQITAHDTDIPDALSALLVDIQRLCRDDAYEYAGAALIDALGGAQRVLDAFDGYESPEKSSPILDAPQDVKHIEYNYLPALQRILCYEAVLAGSGKADWIPRVFVRSNGIELLGRHNPADLPSHVVWCDATGTASMYEQLFQRPVRVVRPHVNLKSRIKQVYNALYTKSSMLPSVTASDATKAQAAMLRSQVKDYLSRLAARHTSFAVISYKDLVADIAPQGAKIAHFGGNRGSNELEHCEALAVVGTPMWAPNEIIRTASMLFDDDDPFNTTWTQQEKRYKGVPASSEVPGFWHDPRLAMILEASRDDELIQSLNRIRPVRYKDRTIYLFTRYPLSLYNVELMTINEIYGAVRPDGTPIIGIPAKQFPTITAMAALLAEENGEVTPSALATALGVGNTTATTYCKALIEAGLYVATTNPMQRRGRPALRLFPTKGNGNR